MLTYTVSTIARSRIPNTLSERGAVEPAPIALRKGSVLRSPLNKPKIVLKVASSTNRLCAKLNLKACGESIIALELEKLAGLKFAVVPKSILPAVACETIRNVSIFPLLLLKSTRI